MQKNFSDWLPEKENIHNSGERVFFQEREVWMMQIGCNVGFEIDGKGKEKSDFLRPVLVLRKLSKETFLGLPLTSKEKNGSWYHPIRIKEVDGFVIFSQIRSFDAKRLRYKMEQIGKKEFQEIKETFKDFL